MDRIAEYGASSRDPQPGHDWNRKLAFVLIGDVQSIQPPQGINRGQQRVTEKMLAVEWNKFRTFIGPLLGTRDNNATIKRSLSSIPSGL